MLAAASISFTVAPQPSCFTMTSTFLTGQTLHIDGGEPLSLNTPSAADRQPDPGPPGSTSPAALGPVSGRR